MRPIGNIPMSIMMAAGILFSGAAGADEMRPGAGVVVKPGQDQLDNDNFQTFIVVEALTDLVYDVRPVQYAKFPALHLSLASGDLTFIADHWIRIHQQFYDLAGGDEKLSRTGGYITDTGGGYYIDKRTADQYGVTNIGQLTDPEIARLFDADGDGKADLAGCAPGWGCETDIEFQLDAYGLRDTVTHNQGEYEAMIADTIARYQNGQPVLYFTWTPYWVSGFLVPGKDVEVLEVPFSAMPGGEDTTLPDGRNVGFISQTVYIVANREFVEANPAAGRLFELMHVPVNDVSAQGLYMKEEGQGTVESTRRHAVAWIEANRETYDGWLAEARAAAAAAE